MDGFTNLHPNATTSHNLALVVLSEPEDEVGDRRSRMHHRIIGSAYGRERLSDRYSYYEMHRPSELISFQLTAR